MQYYNQIITLVLEALDDPESSIRELAASAMFEMLKNQVCLLYPVKLVAMLILFGIISNSYS